jgi:APA family basic amino acid/polyamine antiporter
LYGWTTFAVINTASIAAVAIAFATYLAYFFPMDDWAVKGVAIASILILSAINCLGVKMGALVQNTVTMMKLGAMFSLILMSFFLSGGRLGHFEPVLPTLESSRFLNPEGWGPLGLALIAVLWAYDGWIQITYVAGEIKQPQKTIPKALLLSTLMVVTLYTLINVAYIYVLSVQGIAHAKLVASDTAQTILGPVGASFVSLAVVISTFGANNSFILTGARVYYAMAKEGVFFNSVARLHPVSQAPVSSLVAQGLWSCLLVLSGTYDQLFTYVVFAAWIFYAMSCLAVFVLRRKEPGMQRPYRTWGYPVTPLLFILFAIWLVMNTVIEAPRDSAIGLGIILMGLPPYFYWKKRKRSES